MVFLIFSFFFFAAPYQLQTKYDYCKSVSFEAKDDYCSLQKKLNKLGEKYDSGK